ncbi:hypothetical protein HYV44_02935 [Candidatus Microgenomates bacterium]|nr:hypothetical protein [Candidatus Microgenomates bacterium]
MSIEDPISNKNNNDVDVNVDRITSMPEEEFKKQFPENGFGWESPRRKGEEDKFQDAVCQRWNEIRKKNPLPPIYIGTAPKSSEQEVAPDSFEPPYVRNLDGQIVGANNEPIRRGSSEWEKASRHNTIPLNQEDERK